MAENIMLSDEHICLNKEGASVTFSIKGDGEILFSLISGAMKNSQFFAELIIDAASEYIQNQGEIDPSLN